MESTAPAAPSNEALAGVAPKGSPSKPNDAARSPSESPPKAKPWERDPPERPWECPRPKKVHAPKSVEQIAAEAVLRAKNRGKKARERAERKAEPPPKHPLYVVGPPSPVGSGHNAAAAINKRGERKRDGVTSRSDGEPSPPKPAPQSLGAEGAQVPRKSLVQTENLSLRAEVSRLKKRVKELEEELEAVRSSAPAKVGKGARATADGKEGNAPRGSFTSSSPKIDQDGARVVKPVTARTSSERFGGLKPKPPDATPDSSASPPRERRANGKSRPHKPVNDDTEKTTPPEQAIQSQESATPAQTSGRDDDALAEALPTLQVEETNAERTQSDAQDGEKQQSAESSDQVPVDGGVSTNLADGETKIPIVNEQPLERLEQPGLELPEQPGLEKRGGTEEPDQLVAEDDHTADTSNASIRCSLVVDPAAVNVHIHMHVVEEDGRGVDADLSEQCASETLKASSFTDDKKSAQTQESTRESAPATDVENAEQALLSASSGPIVASEQAELDGSSEEVEHHSATGTIAGDGDMRG
ncbi:hypothetical protein AB1Y20_018587 [Prymnesium parvum]|uniref:Uncharacterized protein n=1 Tax=Prymnesium parvum TaxID=97485 RepID=A0AB34JS99_PRYPA